MQQKSNLKPIIIFLTLALAIVIGIIFLFGFVIHTIAAEPASTSTVSALTEPSAVPNKPVAVEAVQAPAAPAVDTAIPAAAPVAAVAPAATVQPAYTYSAEMSAAGVSQADYGYVTDMVLGDHGWRTVGPALWKYATRNASEGLFWNLQRVDHYVSITYGSWAAAHDAWVSGGDF
ncbi:hypothetical protein QN355_11680 [Cryobacterium sp. 10S3]|uniref:hypothetical protein n=1 Tax=Cryobacterium sp. 10S3 TaxID=3048582 RepID=UPI002AC9AD32|nr:hypothetical protein [Cryobacterium sp. 10S3]MEB0287214.1 hypothetical protein [Cryobacterium sp. 10S3]WPX14169.1 hypothetical protein RHM57_02000 [Cryobacterium sp. 10S3]